MVKIKQMRAFFLLCFLVLLTSCAQRLEEFETRLQDVDERVRVVENESGLPVGSDRQLLKGRKLADVRTQVTAMRNELRLLEGKVQALEFESKSLAKKQRQLEAELARTQEKYSQLKTAPPLSGEKSVEAAYRKALNSYQDGDFDRSRRLFKDFIEKYPEHSLGDNAAYWVAESYFRQEKYREALVRFQDLVEKFPESDKKCVAMDRQVKAFEALGMTKEASSYADLRTEECRKQ